MLPCDCVIVKAMSMPTLPWPRETLRHNFGFDAIELERYDVLERQLCALMRFLRNADSDRQLEVL